MGEKGDYLFNFIAPIYSLFYNMQKRMFTKVVENAERKIDLSSTKTVIDIGCGTGALSSVLSDKGMTVTGIDTAEKMIKIARGKAENKKIKFIKANVLDKLPFDDKSFDVAISSYVAHGLKAEERKTMYIEMSRLARHYVIIHDYSNERALLTTIVEWFEGGNYFNYIKNAETEMQEFFADVQVIKVDVRANWYIGKLKE